jgi:hypothetical protein
MKRCVAAIAIMALLAGCGRPAPKPRLQMVQTATNSVHDYWDDFSTYGSELITSDWDLDFTVNQIEDGELVVLKSFSYSASEDRMVIISPVMHDGTKHLEFSVLRNHGNRKHFWRLPIRKCDRVDTSYTARDDTLEENQVRFTNYLFYRIIDHLNQDLNVTDEASVQAMKRATKEKDCGFITVDLVATDPNKPDAGNGK